MTYNPNWDVGAVPNSPLDVLQVYLSATYAIVSATPTKIALDGVNVDTQGAYDNVAYRYTPNVAGWYEFTFQIDATLAATNNYVAARIYFNGAVRCSHNNYSPLAVATYSQVLAKQHMNGTTDFVEFYGFISNGTQVIGSGTSLATYAEATLLNPD